MYELVMWKYLILGSNFSFVKISFKLGLTKTPAKYAQIDIVILVTSLKRKLSFKLF